MQNSGSIGNRDGSKRILFFFISVFVLLLLSLLISVIIPFLTLHPLPVKYSRDYDSSIIQNTSSLEDDGSFVYITNNKKNELETLTFYSSDANTSIGSHPSKEYIYGDKGDNGSNVSISFKVSTIRTVRSFTVEIYVSNEEGKNLTKAGNYSINKIENSFSTTINSESYIFISKINITYSI